jgi:hypothetical protein
VICLGKAVHNGRRIPLQVTPVILATQEAEIRRIEVKPVQQIVHGTLSQKNPSQIRAGEVAQSAGPEFKPQHTKQTISFCVTSLVM